ncbi:MFS transporter [Sciscionella marina]|uniref:MFS transporter n=1 Tax=Sciscionella marina TaxID=508770 RepID=UPI000A04EACA|nr:MFS transporter [Sciscionella marina]
MTRSTGPGRTADTSKESLFSKDNKGTQVRIFLITWIAYAAYYFTRQAFSAAKVGILADPSVNKTLDQHMLGNLDALYLFGYAAGQFTWGHFADRYGPRVVVLGGMTLSVVATAFLGLTTAVFFFIPLMLVQGLAQATGWAPLCKNVSAFFPARVRGRLLGVWSTNYAFGGLAAAPFAGWIAYSIAHSWRAAFFAGAAVLVLATVLVFLFQRDSPADAERERAPRPERAGIAAMFRAAFADRMVLTIGFCYFFVKPARYAILLWGPVLVAESVPGVSAVTAVFVPVAFGIAGVLAPILIGYASDKLFGARRVPPCVLALGGLVVILTLTSGITATGSIPLITGALALIGLTAYGADAMLSSVAAVDFGTSEHAAGATGFVNGCGSVGAILGGLLPGYLSTNGLFYVFAAAALLAALLLCPQWNRRPAAA